MQRNNLDDITATVNQPPAPQPETSRKEWVKYYLNEAETQREVIYQAIINRGLYQDKIVIEKKRHIESHEKSCVDLPQAPGSQFSLMRFFDNKQTSDNISASMNLNARSFVDKHAPTSEEFKILIERMIHCVEMFYEAEINYPANTDAFKTSIRQFISYPFELDGIQSSYNNLHKNILVEQCTFMFDMTAYAVNAAYKIKSSAAYSGIPVMAFDFSHLKDKWDEKASNKKKSKYIKKYVSLLIEQMDHVRNQWENSAIAADPVAKAFIHLRFDEFKLFLIKQQLQCIDLDATQPRHSVLSSFTSLFRRNDDDNPATPLLPPSGPGLGKK